MTSFLLPFLTKFQMSLSLFLSSRATPVCEEQQVLAIDSENTCNEQNRIKTHLGSVVTRRDGHRGDARCREERNGNGGDAHDEITT